MTAYAPKTQYKLFMREIAGITDFTTFMSKVEAIWGLDGFLSEFHESGIFNTVVSDTAPSDTTAIWIDPNNPATGSHSVVKMYNGSDWVTGTWQLFSTNLIAGSPAGASPGTVVPSEESVISSDGETMINPSAGAITVGSDTTQSGLTGQGFVTIADYIMTAVGVVAASSIQSINGIDPDASGNVDLEDVIPTRTPDIATQETVFIDNGGIGKFQTPDSIFEFNVCAENGSDAPAGLPVGEKMYIASGNNTKILMVLADDNKFYSVNYLNIESFAWFNGSVFNGRANDPCNINFQTQNFIRRTDEIAPTPAKAFWSSFNGTAQGPNVFPWVNQQGGVPDVYLEFDSTLTNSFSFDVRWFAVQTGDIPLGLQHYISYFDRDKDYMSPEMFYPSKFGLDYQNYKQTGVITPQTHATAGPNIFLTQDLNPGDTVVHMTDVSFWDANNTFPYRTFRFCNYTDSNGFEYLDYSPYMPDYVTPTSNPPDWGAFEPTGAINTSLNTITLRNPWGGPMIPAGTNVASSYRSGLTFNYTLIEHRDAGDDVGADGIWRNVQYTILPITDVNSLVPLEGSFVKFGLWANRGPGTNANNNFFWDFANFKLEVI